MKDLSAYYEIARLITAELSETITPEEKGRLNVWLAEDERHYMRYCRIRERLKRGEGENVFRNPERVREDMEKLKKKLSGNKRRFLLSGNYFWRYAAVAVFTIGIAIGSKGRGKIGVVKCRRWRNSRLSCLDRIRPC